MVKIRKVKCPEKQIPIKCPYSMKPTRIVIHNTANDASADNEIAYMHRNNNQTSFHYAVDDKEAVQGIEVNCNAWHAGDGLNGIGNRQGIGIEICYSKSGGAKWLKAVDNAADLTARLLLDFGWGIDKVTKHQDYSGKYCPHRILNEYGWQNFLNLVKAKKTAYEIERAPQPKAAVGELTGFNISRSTDALVLYTGKASTGTNKWGAEVALNKAFVAQSKPVSGKGNMEIPSGGYVLSGHGKNADWITKNIKKGSTVKFAAKIEK